MKNMQSLALALAMLLNLGVAGDIGVQAKTLSAQAKRYEHKSSSYFQRHPYQKTGLIGAGAGAAVGGLLFGGEHHTGRNMVRGAAAGAAAGLGYEYLKKRGTFK